MTLTFRNLNISPDAPVAQWPAEALQTALERGELADWRRIAAEVRRRPWGQTAVRLEEVLSHSRPYGISDAMDRVLTDARAGAARR